MEITEAKIKLMPARSDRLQAFCTITIDNDFVIRDIKIIEGAKGAFVATVELAPPQGWDLGRILKSAQAVHYAGFDAVNIPDGPRASARMGPLAMASVIERVRYSRYVSVKGM